MMKLLIRNCFGFWILSRFASLLWNVTATGPGAESIRLFSILLLRKKVRRNFGSQRSIASFVPSDTACSQVTGAVNEQNFEAESLVTCVVFAVCSNNRQPTTRQQDSAYEYCSRKQPEQQDIHSTPNLNQDDDHGRPTSASPACHPAAIKARGCCHAHYG